MSQDKIDEFSWPEIPARQDICVMGPDEKKPFPIGWIIKDYNGAVIFPLTSGGVVIKSPITSKDGLKDGMLVSAWGSHWEVKSDSDGEFYLDGEFNKGLLSFAEDDRKCWVCWGGVNKRGLCKNTIVE